MWATIPMFRMRSVFRIISGMAFANSARMCVMSWLSYRPLARRLGDPLNLFLAPDRERRLVALGGEADLVGEACGDVLRGLVGRLDGPGGDVPDRDVQTSGRRGIDSARHGDPAELQARDLFPGGRVLDGVHQELERVLIL